MAKTERKDCFLDTEMKNRLWCTFLLVLLVFLMLLGLFYLPHTDIYGKDLRRVNIMSDIQHRDESGNIIAEVKADSADGYVEKNIDSAAVKVKQMAYVDSVPTGMVAIEDFADVNGINREMDHFYSALSQASSRPVRIAYFGDSYIEGDILTMDLRAMLQKRFGGRGMGFVEIECVSSDFRRSVNTRHSGWQCYHANERGRGFNAISQGIAGSYFIPHDTATFEMTCQRNVYPQLLDTASVATVFFTPGNGLNVYCGINRNANELIYSNGTASAAHTHEETIAYLDSDSVTRYKTVIKANNIPQQGAGNVVARKIERRIGRLRLGVKGGNGSRFYGVALDGKKGIVLDNFSMRGSGGQHLAKIPQETLSSFAAVRPYDLIILHFGLNVASAKQKDYGTYARQMAQVVQHIKAAYPNASILIVSMADRDMRGADGQLHTMGGVRELISYERKMASDERVAFWNLYEAMGGDGSVARMTEKKQANLDYTHINFAGGKHIAGLLFNVLMNGKSNYDSRMR